MILDDDSIQIERRGTLPSDLAMREGAGTVSGRQWTYDESSLRLTNAVLDTELKLDQAALAKAQWDRLPPVAARCRVGDLTFEFSIERQQVAWMRDHEQPSNATWWCVDYADALGRDLRHVGPLHPRDADLMAWNQFDWFLGDGLSTFVLLMPPNGTHNFVHLIGGRIGSEWLPRFFRSFGYSAWYPRGEKWLPLICAETARHTNVAADGWQFEDGARPQIIHRPSGTMLIHLEGNAPSMETPFAQHWFLYECGVVRHRLPVAVRTLASCPPLPRVWQIDYRAAFEITSGTARSRTHSAIPGAARISESEWRALDKVLVEGFLRWPHCAATGLPPLWLELAPGGYREGLWASRPCVVGLNDAVTQILGRHARSGGDRR